MNIQVKTDNSSDITAFKLKGELDFNEFLTFVKTHHKQSIHTNKCLWDFRSVTGGESVSVLQMGKFYGLCNHHFFGQGTHKIAFLVSDEMEFGFAQVMSTIEEIYDVFLNVRVFKSQPKAIIWLEEGSL